MSDWSHKAAEEFKKNRQTVQARSEAQMWEDRKKREGGVGLWRALWEALEKGCKDFNRDAGEAFLLWASESASEIRVIGQFVPKQATLMATYDENKYRLKYSSGPNQQDEIAVGLNGGEATFVNSNGQVLTVESVANRLLDSLLARQRPGGI